MLAGPGPAGVVHVVDLGPAQRVQSADRVEGGDLLRDRVRHAVLGQQLADRPVLALGARTVVAPDIEDEGVVAQAQSLQPVHQLADLGVGVLDEAGEHLHQAALERLFRIRDAVPGGHGVGTRRERRLGRDPALGLLAREHPFAIGVPAVVELALVLVGPVLEHMMRAMGGAGGPVHEERLVRREGPVLAQPGQGLVRQVLGEVIGLARGRLDRSCVLEQPRLVLRGLAGQEAVEIVEAIAGGPALERAHGRGLGGRGVVPLAEGRGLVAVVLEHLGQSGGALGNDAGIAVEVQGPLGDGARADTVVVAPGQKRRAGGRTDRCGVKAVVAQSLAGQPGEGGRGDLAAEGVGKAEADVIEQHDQDVGRIRRQAIRLDPPNVFGLLEGGAGHAGCWSGWKRKIEPSFAIEFAAPSRPCPKGAASGPRGDSSRTRLTRFRRHAPRQTS